LLLAIVGVRVAGVAGVGQPAMLAATELALVAALAAAVVPALVRAGVWEAVVGVVAVVALVFGITRAPVDTLVVLAFLHNTTPVGFLAERLGGAARRRAMMACAVAFLVVPALIATGVMTRVLGGIGVGSTGAGWLGVGTLLDNAAAFVPSFVGSAYTADLFRCAAYLQCLHYAVVLIVLPRLGAGATPGGRVAWPALQPFIVWVAALGVLLSILFAVAFNDARAIYGVFAAVHAWIEIPVLLLALTLLPPVSARWKRTHSPLL